MPEKELLSCLWDRAGRKTKGRDAHDLVLLRKRGGERFIVSVPSFIGMLQTKSYFYLSDTKKSEVHNNDEESTRSISDTIFMS